MGSPNTEALDAPSVWGGARGFLLGLVSCCAVLAAPGAAGAASAVLPDLVSDAPGTSVAPEIHTDAQGSRLLLRFDGFVHNRGAGALELRGSAPSGAAMTSVVQRVYDDAGGFADIAPGPAARLVFEPSDGHDHWHLRNAVRYSLWDAGRTTIVAPAQKVGFCLLDSQRVDAHAPAQPFYTSARLQFCGQRQPAAAEVFMGVSAGYRDFYVRTLPFQWVDISDVTPGTYWLRADADPDGAVVESVEANPGAYGATASTVNGYVAQPVARGRVSSVLPSTIKLVAERFDDVWPGGPGQLEFKIVTPPSAGRLSQPTGVWFTGSQVTYMPRLGFNGADSFTYAARDAASPFPLTPRTAPVTLTTGGLVAAGARTATAAPQRLAIGPPRAAPSVAAPAPGRHPLSRIALARHGRQLLASVIAGRAGIVRIAVRHAGRLLGTCATRAPAGTPATCAFDLPRSIAPRPLLCSVPRTRDLRLPALTVRATLTAGGEVVAARHASPRAR